MLQVFEGRVLRKIFGPKGVEVAGQFMVLYDKEFAVLCRSLRVFRRVK
jgi:hypothetical protein